MEKVIIGLSKHFKALNIDFFIVGAQARDIISKQVKLKLSPRKTADVDFGIMVDTWETLEKLRELFNQDKNIKLGPGDNKIRYYFQGTPFDLVPFGGVEKKGKVSLPPFYETILTVIGYKEAIENSKVVKVGETEVKVVTPEMLIALKLVAWGENQSRQKDAQDISYIIKNYGIIDQDMTNCLFENFLDVLEYFNHDHWLAGSALIGIRINKFSSPEHIALILSSLDDLEIKRRLARNMSGLSSDAEVDDDENLRYLDALIYGIKY